MYHYNAQNGRQTYRVTKKFSVLKKGTIVTLTDKKTDTKGEPFLEGWVAVTFGSATGYMIEMSNLELVKN